MAWFQDWITRFLANPGQNDATKYGVAIIPASTVSGQSYYRAIGVHHRSSKASHRALALD